MKEWRREENTECREPRIFWNTVNQDFLKVPMSRNFQEQYNNNGAFLYRQQLYGGLIFKLKTAFKFYSFFIFILIILWSRRVSLEYRINLTIGEVWDTTSCRGHPWDPEKSMLKPISQFVKLALTDAYFFQQWTDGIGTVHSNGLKCYQWW